MSTIDLGNGQLVQRQDVPKSQLQEYDQASTALKQAQASIRSSVKPMAMDKTIDLGNGQAVQRRHLPKHIQNNFDEATTAFKAAQDSVRSWVGSLTAMQAPAGFSGSIVCTTPGQSGLNYNLNEVGGALMVMERDLSAFAKLGFSSVPSVQPTTGLRIGLVFFDTAASQYMRYDGAEWAPVTLN